MRHPISGEIKEVSKPEFMAMFDSSVHAAIDNCAKKQGVEAVVCLESLQMDSSQLGNRTAMIVGPGCTYKLADLETGCRLGDVPSRFQYPVAFYRV